jgi:gliding motility-associated transport system permease protein
MRNVLAIAERELRAYFASPIAYAVIGFFALVFGWMFYAFLRFFITRSMSMGPGGMGQGPVNINEMLIRPLVLQISIIVLFALPMVTMRTYSEEKRSGTIELLLTSPITDLQIILGKFLGALALYALMLLITVPSIAVLFWYGDPDWKPVVTSYLGLLLMGGSFIAFGLFISSMTKNQVVAGFLTFCTLLMLLLVGWVQEFVGPIGQAIVSALAIFDHFEDFSKGVLDTKHLVYYLSVITFGLFLTAKSVDSERWRG